MPYPVLPGIGNSSYTAFAHRYPWARQRNGFALIIALVLMGFLLLLVISLNLVTGVEMQNDAVFRKNQEARLNALFGLQVAIGELQQHTGADTRVTAEAGILEAEDTAIGHPRWMGVWKTGTDANPELLTWLVSGNASLLASDSDFIQPTASLGSADSVELVGRGTTSADGVTVKTVQTDTGNYAYWVSGQQIKALINIGVENTPAGSPDFPKTIASRYRFPHLNLESDPAGSEKISWAQGLAQTALALGLSSAGENHLNSYYHDVTTTSSGLLTNSRSGGLKTDLTALLSGSLPDGYNNEPIYRTDTEIENDQWATQAPTWNYLKAWVEVLDDEGNLNPQTGTRDRPGISPIIAMFKMGFGGGVDTDNTILVNLYPQVILYNPYNVTLKGQDYGLILFGNQMLRQEFGSGLEYLTMPVAMSGSRSKAVSMPVSEGGRHGTFNYEIAKSYIYHSSHDPDGGVFPSIPGTPRFKVEVPDIPPGAAVIFSPGARTAYDRYAGANQSLTAGDGPHSFYLRSMSKLIDLPPTETRDHTFWMIQNPSNNPIYLHGNRSRCRNGFGCSSC